ncbi:MAG: DEAD/DEAH box helicase [Methanolinea sp.]|nr:DEAD/DEAH box helicase [Methanolinea sp.]
MSPIREALDALQNDAGLQEGWVYAREIPARDPVFGSLDPPLPPQIKGFLDSRGIHLYSHQCEAVSAFRDGENFILTTPTASGKTLAFALPVYEELVTRPESTFLFLYPTKALTRDQEVALRALEGGFSTGPVSAVYDGDTETSRRGRIRQEARIILSNCYELHHILSWHHQWSRFFRGLCAVVVDEAHRYRGVFGSHVALLLRRLRRVCRNYGAAPRFVLSSATLANPAEFARKLCGVPFRVISRDGSPGGSRTIAFYNPCREWPPRRSMHHDSARVVARCMEAGLQTLCFSGSRRTAELVASWTREEVADVFRPALEGMVASYRAGYLPEERRAIEEGLKSGTLRGVVSTNALELGIDVGTLDAVVLSGFPGTMMAAWQQVGRAGRNARDALAILVASPNPLDQYFMHHPDAFFGAPLEHAIIDLENPYILSGQVLCAAAELPLDCDADRDLFPPTLPLTVSSLAAQSLLGRTRRGWIYAGTRRAADLVSLEGGFRETFAVLCNGRVLETLDRAQAYREAHKGAILLHQGEQFRVESFDLESRTIHVTPVDVDYYTRPLKSGSVRVTAVRASRELPGARLHYGDVEVTEQYTAYKMIERESVIGIEPLDLPPVQFPTRSLWLEVAPGPCDAVSLSGRDLAGGLHGMEHALIAVMPFHVLCDRWDIGGLSTPCGGESGQPTVFVYDGYEGGIGLAEKGYEICETLLSTARALVADCGCDRGCPSCILSPKCGSDNQPLDKEAAHQLLSLVLDNG